nr:hypothetical protein OH820_11815 [Streptomyces sp. NBC_00857]
MADQPKSSHKAPGLEQTDFESKTHQELLDMLDGASSESASRLAKKLSDASSKIDEIGMGLKGHASRVVWDGEGGEAFRNWCHQAAMATLELAKYSKQASSSLAEVATAIAYAKDGGVPGRPAALETQAKEARSTLKAAQNDPGAPKDLSKYRNQESTALAGMESARLEAADQMRRLAQTYAGSGDQIMSLQPPTFPPPPGQFMPPPARSLSNSSRRGGGSVTEGGSSGESSAHSYPSSASDSSSSIQNGSLPLESVSRVTPPSTVVPDRPVDMEIDGATTLPQTPTSQSPIQGTAPVGGKPDGLGSPPLPGVIPPAFGGGVTPPNSGPTGGRTGTGIRGPLLPGQGSASTVPPGRMPQQNGIVGGRPVPQNSGRPTGGIPRGTVIGGETGQGRGYGQGRAGMGMPHGPGGGIGQGGMAAGRRLASESGGVVGGKPRQQGATGKPFTPGGSGLVRKAPADGDTRNGRSGAVPPGTRRPRSRQERENGERPDYLVEDEETWQQGSRRIVPPVID